MEKTTRIRINLNNREVEWEGSEEFIKKYENVIDDFIEKIGNSPTATKKESAPDNANFLINPTRTSSTLPSSFGEFYIKFPRNLKVVDKVLLAAYYIQGVNEDGLFNTKEVTEALNEQNIEVTNTNAFITSLMKTSKIFKKSGKFKVSEKGIESIEGIISANQKYV